MIVVEERKSYGNVPTQPQQTSQVSLGQLINDLIKYGVTRYKFMLAMKLAKPACQKDPQNCSYYIRQAFRSLGIDIPVTMANRISQQQGNIYQQLPQRDTNKGMSLSTAMLLMGGAVVGGVLLAYYLTNR